MRKVQPRASEIHGADCCRCPVSRPYLFRGHNAWLRGVLGGFENFTAVPLMADKGYDAVDIIVRTKALCISGR